MKPRVERSRIVGEPMKHSTSSIEREEKPTVPGEVGNKEADEKPLKSSTPREGRISGAKPPIMIAKRGLDEKVVIIGGIREDEKTPAEVRRHKVEQQIAARDMETPEKIPEKIPVQEKSSAGEIKEKPLKEIPQSRPMSSDKAELDRKRGPIEPIPPKTPEQERKVDAFSPDEEMGEVQGEEELEETIATRYLEADERAPYPAETSFLPKKPETAITAQKPAPQSRQLTRTDHLKDSKALNKYDTPSGLKDESISAAHPAIDSNSSTELGERIVQPKPASLIATEEEVSQFFDDYVERYNHKDISGFLSLFSPDAIQNKRDGFNEIKEIYSDFFDKSQELGYHIQYMTINIYQDAVEVVGHYKVAQKGKRASKVKVWEGDIRWVLVRENGALKIRHLDFRHQKSPQ